MIRIILQECHTVYEKECTTETKHKYKEGSSNNLKEILGLSAERILDLFRCNFIEVQMF